MCRLPLRRSRVALLFGLTLLALPALMPAQPAPSPTIKLGGDVSLTIRGILSSTVFMQDALFRYGNGQQAEFVLQELEGWWHGGDVRNMRLTLEFQGPEFGGGWRGNANFEADLFGGFNGAGAFGDEQPLPRLRLAYADLTNGRTTLRVGQAWALTLGNIPMSTTHIGFPLGWGSGGFIGWRFPGIFFFQSLSPSTAATRLQFQLAVLRGSWFDETAADGPSAGEAGTPQLEARLNLDGRLTGGTWGAYVVGHWDRKNLNGVRNEGTPEPAERNLTSQAIEAGLRLQSGTLTLHGNGYFGRAMGHHFAHFQQNGDISGWGAWAQVGFDLNRRWSLWAYAGMEDADEADVVGTNVPTASTLLVPMLRFKAGAYSLGVEWLHNRADYRVGATGPTTERTGNQIALSVRYDF